MSRDLAFADLLAAASSLDILGVAVVIDGKECVVSKVGLSAEESQSFSAAGMMVEGFRISMDAAVIGWQPAVGSWLTVDDREYEVVKSMLSGSLLRLTLTRNVG
jgi:hypothetical protein